jgi:hypothetical protein
VLSVVALVLWVVGATDVARTWRLRGVRQVGAITSTALAALLFGAWAVGITGSGWWAVPIIGLGVSGWIALSDGRLGLPPAAALWWLAAGLGLAIVCGGAVRVEAGAAQRWYERLEIEPLDGVAFARCVAVAAVMVFLYASANVVVRLVLLGAGRRVLNTESTVKGGRILGPLERWFIFAMALGGQFGAIAAIVAAKGIVRFPEISTSQDKSNDAEYVLVGSFVSWALAFAFVPLLH